MWHLKTKLGVFWVAPVSDSSNKYFLGVNNEELGLYTDVEQAAKDVHDHATGYLKWDTEIRNKAPEHITQWVLGEPKEWRSNKD